MRTRKRTGIIRDPRYADHCMEKNHPECPERLDVIYAINPSPLNSNRTSYWSAPVLTFIMGTLWIDLAAATGRGILVTNTPDVLTDATADLTFALILALARRIVAGDRRTPSGQFQYWAPLTFLGTEVSGKTLGIVGMSRKNPNPPDTDFLVQYTDFDTLLKISDFVSLHVPLTPETHHLIGKNELEKMKPTAFLINTSRGPVVDEAALTDILFRNRIAGTGLDVYEHEPVLAQGLADCSKVY